MIAGMPEARRSAARLALALAAMAAPSGCGALDQHQAKKIPHPGIVDLGQPRELQMVTMPRYVVEPPDELEISARPAALEVPLLTVTVQPDGVIDLGYVGDVYVAGLTLEEIEMKVAHHLMPLADARKVRGPIEVSVRLLNGTQSKTYYVLGAVTTQGKFPITGNETVLDAIMMAGLRSNSYPDKAYVTRPQPHGARPLVLKVDWEGIKDRGDTTTNYQLFPGDRVVVPGGKPPGLLGTLFGG